MKTPIVALAVGIVLAGPVRAYATEHVARPFHTHRTIQSRPVVRHFDASVWLTPAATAAAPAVGPGSSHDPFIPRRKDGLSSNPDACVNYGCVGAGGGGD